MHIHRTRVAGRPRRWFAVAFVTLSAMLAAPAAALALQPPTILSAGINAADQLYMTWALGAGTVYDQAQFATAPALEPGSPFMFDLDNVLGFECGDLDECPDTPALTSYTLSSPVPRDRRYYAMVSSAAGSEILGSTVWVIDADKPLLAGPLPETSGLPGVGDLAIGSPVTGRPLTTPVIAPPPPAIGAAPAPSASIAVPKLPRRIGEILRRGVRVKVTCGGPCAASAQLLLGGQSLAAKHISPRAAGARTIELRPQGAARNRLRNRPRARLQIAVTVTPAGGAAKHVSRSFLVLR
jgi:hypothetical protein